CRWRKDFRRFVSSFCPTLTPPVFWKMGESVIRIEAESPSMPSQVCGALRRPWIRFGHDFAGFAELVCMQESAAWNGPCHCSASGEQYDQAAAGTTGGLDGGGDA